MQAGQSYIHSPVFKSADLRSVKAGFVRKFILRPALLRPQLPYALPQPLLYLLPLHQKQFRGILLKRILLIRRASPGLQRCAVSCKLYTLVE